MSSQLRKRVADDQLIEEEEDKEETVEEFEEQEAEGWLKPTAEEEELWDDSEKVANVKVGGREHDLKRVKKLRKSIVEIGVRMVVHIVLLSVYLAIHVHCADLVKKCPEPTRTKIFYGGVAYGGLWKYLTHLCMWGVGVYFFLAFFTDIMPISQAKSWCRQFSDWFFTTIVWPLAMIVCIGFWSFYLVDPHLIRSTVDVSECYPETLNHALHTAPLVSVLLECVLVYHSYPSSHLAACFSVIMASSAYGIWVLAIFSVTKTWVYPFLSGFTNPFMYIAGMFLFSMIAVGFYYFGRIIASCIWKERFQALNSIDSELLYYDNDEEE